jgi:hypothetical protein
VAAIPFAIQRTSYGELLRLLRKANAAGRLKQAQGDMLSSVLAYEDAAGPPGWSRWLRDFRNMNVHRGRRLTANHLVKRRPVLLGPSGQPVLRADVVTVLPTVPGCSDVQAMLNSSDAQLTEPALTTLGGLVGTTRYFANALAGDLVALWRRRRNDPNLLAQPAEQWPRLKPRSATRFCGFEPGTAPSTADGAVSSETLLKRLQAAALDTRNRGRWESEFDE